MILKERIDETVECLQGVVGDFKPDIGIILGTGLGALATEIRDKKEIAYAKVPNFCISTVEFHEGNLIFGNISGKKVVAMQGRFHFYEGYSLEQITFPVRVMKALGAKYLIVSNAAGGMNPNFNLGAIMVITDHINLMGVNPLIGPNDEKLGPRYPDMCNCYDKALVRLVEEVSVEIRQPVQKGVYVGVTGPNLETAAEYRFLRLIGADAVGMSTVPEVIVGVHCGLNILGLSIITDLCLPDCLEPADIAKIIKTAQTAEPKLQTLILKTIERVKV